MTRRGGHFLAFYCCIALKRTSNIVVDYMKRVVKKFQNAPTIVWFLELNRTSFPCILLAFTSLTLLAVSVGAECTIYGGVIGFQTGASSPFRTISQIEVLSVIYILSRIVSSLCVCVIVLWMSYPLTRVLRLHSLSSVAELALIALCCLGRR